MFDRVFVRDLAPAESSKLLGIVRRRSGSVVRWRKAQIVLWAAQRIDVPPGPAIPTHRSVDDDGRPATGLTASDT